MVLIITIPLKYRTNYVKEKYEITLTNCLSRGCSKGTEREEQKFHRSIFFDLIRLKKVTLLTSYNFFKAYIASLPKLECNEKKQPTN